MVKTKRYFKKVDSTKYSLQMAYLQGYLIFMDTHTKQVLLAYLHSAPQF